MVEKTLKQRLADGQTVRVMALGALASPKFIEIAALAADVHGIWIDQEHVAIPHPQLEVLLMACRSVGLDAFARVPPTDYCTIMRPMEAGASGVMVAQINTLEQVEQIVRWAKYPPMGERGMFRSNYEAGYGTTDTAEHAGRANRDRWLVIQIETASALECVEQIAAVEAVDCVFVGPGDLALNLGVPGQVMHAKCVKALKRVSAAAAAAGKPWGNLCTSEEHAALCLSLGCRLISVVTDTQVLRLGFEAAKSKMANVFSA